VPGGHVRIYRRGVLATRLGRAGLRSYGLHFAHALHTPYWWLRCAVGVGDDRHPLVRAFHRVLVWDMATASPLTRVPERVLNPVLGKSMVLYARKPDAPADHRRGGTIPSRRPPWWLPARWVAR
jgi:hypothetical protein